MSRRSGQPVALDLFSGAGGLTEGLLAAGVNVAVAVENHPHPALTHSFNHPDTTIICDDLCSIDLGVIKEHLKERSGDATLDLLVGGPPCQGFSPAGKQNRHDPRNRLFEEFLRLLEAFSPRMFLFENVPGFARLYEGRMAEDLLTRVRALGYSVHGVDSRSSSRMTKYPILNAARYGVPQFRRRLLLVGWKSGCLTRPFRWPRAIRALPNRDGQPRGRPVVTVEEAIGDLAFLSAGAECHAYLDEPTYEYQRQRRSGCTTLFNHLTTKHQKPTVDLFRRLSPGHTVLSIPNELRSGKQRMRRWAKDEASWAVLALPDDYIHYQRHRIPTVREMARLQSFDDDFVFLGKRTTSEHQRRIDVPQYTQVGNAVPPLLARAVGRSLVRSLGGQVRDLRNIEARRSRHDWIRGSSSFIGYTLTNDSVDQLDLFDSEGKHLRLPIPNEEEPLNGKFARAAWAGRKLRRVDQLLLAQTG